MATYACYWTDRFVSRHCRPTSYCLRRYTQRLIRLVVGLVKTHMTFMLLRVIFVDVYPQHLKLVTMWFSSLRREIGDGMNKRNKTAELQRRPRDAPNIRVPWKLSIVLTTHPATFPEICNGLFFWSILRMCVQNLKFVALPVHEIIEGTQKIWAVPVYAHAPFSPTILKGFCSDGPCEYTCQVRSS